MNKVYIGTAKKSGGNSDQFYISVSKHNNSIKRWFKTEELREQVLKKCYKDCIVENHNPSK